jgi:hypothetical protein
MPESDEICVEMKFIGFQHVPNMSSTTENVTIFALDLSVHNMNSKLYSS